MAIYPTPNVTDLQDIETTFTWINNTASGGMFFPLIILAVWSIAFIGSISEGRQAYRAFIFANFIGIILSVIFGLLGWLNPSYIYFQVIMLGFGLIWAKLSRR